MRTKSNKKKRAELVVLISGGSGGIGKVTADLFAARGHIVFEVSRGGESRTGVTHLSGDVTRPADMQNAVAEVARRAGRLDIVICNAGFGIGGSVENTTPADAQNQFAVNFHGAFHLIQAAIPVLRDGGGGRVLAVSSVAAVVPIPFQAFYSATKAALNQLIMALANELRPFQIDCAVLMPGDTKTGFTSNRVKNQDENEVYGDAVRRSLERMEQDELNGGAPEDLAAALYRLATRRGKPKPLNGVGVLYRLVLVLIKFLPSRPANWVLGRLYARF